MSIIEVNKLTKNYGNNKGVFDLSLSAKKGEIFGFLGPNGAGKTTTIRNLMGFIRADGGNCKIMGMDCHRETDKIQRSLGYLPGEIAFIDNMSGIEFIRFVAKMKELQSLTRAEELIKMLELDPSGKIRRMSKGMKQKIGIVCAFMGNPEVLILDEPTSGLDPLMQKRFDELVLSEKEKGHTVFMSSHIFEEIEKCCDRVAIIKNGRLMSTEDMAKLKSAREKEYVIGFSNDSELMTFVSGFGGEKSGALEATVSVVGSPAPLIAALSERSITSLDVRSKSLEELFMHFYGDKKEETL